MYAGAVAALLPMAHRRAVAWLLIAGGRLDAAAIILEAPLTATESKPERKPRTFTDEMNREWTLKITVGDLKPIREATGVKVAELANDNLKPMGALLGDPERFCAVIWCLIADAAAKSGLTERQFLNAMGGDAAEHAAAALYEAVADFSPSRTRTLLLRTAEKTQELDAGVTAMRLEALGKLTLESLKRKTPSDSPGSSPGSSGSTPDPSPSAS